ncbi:hypothetical protein [Nocardiopsis sp. FR26]|uniref:hypothetical protein n=1 Tax=Nocardiopsis sp. FR26 TaxID=2605987 RepID=UPI00135BD9BD|nr:hypothetical protein [Nocardiopsis sp. FR26]
MGDVRVTLVGVGLVLAVAAIATGIGLELGVGWGLAVGGLLAGLLLVFVVDVGDDTDPGGGDA